MIKSSSHGHDYVDMKPLVVPYILNARLKKAKSPRPNVWFRNFSSAIRKFLTNNVSEDSYYAKYCST
jgi:hypothetical protein